MSLTSINGGKIFPIDRDIVLIGRHETCDIRIDHKSVSKHHCILVRFGDKLMIRDMGSLNGTQINGQRVRRSLVSMKDILGVAGFNFRLNLGTLHSPARPESQSSTAHLDEKDLAKINTSDSGVGMKIPTPVSVAPTIVRRNELPDGFTRVVDSED